MKLSALLPVFLCLPSVLAALELAFPEGSEMTYEELSETGSYALPDAPYMEGYLSTRRVNGLISQQVWQLDGRASTEQMMEPMRRQIEAGGYAILLDCDADSCGGFDFRFSTEVVPAPDMFVDLIDFRFVSALRESFSGSEAISVLVSRTGEAGYMQIIAVEPGSAEAELSLSDAVHVSPTEEAVLLGATVSTLQDSGRVVLRDLSFQTGSSKLANGDFASLTELAGFLNADPNRRIALVGHTDNVGSLENNMALSEKRAASVKGYLTAQLGVAADQIEPFGVGFLSPVDTNATDVGRTANRRVEAVLLQE